MWTKDIKCLRSDSFSEERFQWNFSGLWQGMACCHSSSFIIDTTSVRLVSGRTVGCGRMVGEASEEFREDLIRVSFWGTSRHELWQLSSFWRVWRLSYPFPRHNMLACCWCLGKMSVAQVLTGMVILRHSTPRNTSLLMLSTPPNNLGITHILSYLIQTFPVAS